ncbi:MAG: sensor histidine kinase [Bacillus sp. (in: firmicutes)]
MTIKKNTIDIAGLDEIVDKMVKTVSNSKDEIFKIGEQSRQEFYSLSKELEEIKKLVHQTIEKGDALEVKDRLARNRLAEVKSDFTNFSEEYVRKIYDIASAFQLELHSTRQREKELRLRRDDLDRRLVGLKETIDRAEYLASQVSIVFNFLTSDLAQVGDMLHDAKRHQEFGFKIIEAQEEERKKLSREIHDGPAQMLANVMMRSDLIERVFREHGAEKALLEIRDLRKMVHSALSEVRRIIYDLRPMALDDLGLVPTLRKYLSTIEEYTKTTKIELVTIRQELRLPTKLEVALFRLIQESVQNAIKHAEATLIQVKIEIKKTNVIAVIKDNGKGFELKESKEGSFGLLGMKERVELLDGIISIDSTMGSGTLIMINLPVTV